MKIKSNQLEIWFAEFLYRGGHDPDKMDPVQFKEMKLAFFSGAAHMFKFFHVISEMSEKESFLSFDAIQNELTNYYNSI